MQASVGIQDDITPTLGSSDSGTESPYHTTQASTCCIPQPAPLATECNLPSPHSQLSQDATTGSHHLALGRRHTTQQVTTRTCSAIQYHVDHATLALPIAFPSLHRLQQSAINPSPTTSPLAQAPRQVKARRKRFALLRLFAKSPETQRRRSYRWQRLFTGQR